MMGALMKLNLPYLYVQKDRYGKLRYYVRQRGKKRRVKGEPGSKAFYESYSGLLEGPSLPQPKSSSGRQGTLKWLCERYYQTAEFKSLKPRTQRVRRNILDDICRSEWRDTKKPIGSLPFKQMEKVHVREIRDAKADHPEAANARLKALRQVYKWGEAAGHVEASPCGSVPYVRSRTDGHHAWSLEEVRIFESRHPMGSRERLALSLLLYTGARRSDVVKLGRGMERHGELTFRSSKTGREVTIPIRHELRAAIDACPSGHMTYLVTEFGKPFTAEGFGNWFRRACVKAGVPGRAHGLRKAGATILAENGASSHELMAIFGWESLKQAEGYTRKAGRQKMARSGMAKWNMG